MAVPGTMGKILWVDLSDEELQVETPEDELYEKYLGGYGLGAYYLYKYQEPKVDPLGPDNHLGFFTTVMNGATDIASNCCAVVAKNPKTQAWDAANSGDEFGLALKKAGFDGVIFRGVSTEPVYLLVNDGEAAIVPADEWWGKDSPFIEAEIKCSGKDSLFIEAEIKRLYGPQARAVCIDAAGERRDLRSGIIAGRAAEHNGLGAVMGSKRLKAVVCVGNRPITPADPSRVPSPEELERIGARIGALRVAFNLREGLRNVDFQEFKNTIDNLDLDFVAADLYH